MIEFTNIILLTPGESGSGAESVMHRGLNCPFSTLDSWCCFLLPVAAYCSFPVAGYHLLPAAAYCSFPVAGYHLLPAVAYCSFPVAASHLLPATAYCSFPVSIHIPFGMEVVHCKLFYVLQGVTLLYNDDHIHTCH